MLAIRFQSVPKDLISATASSGHREAPRIVSRFNRSRRTSLAQRDMCSEHSHARIRNGFNRSRRTSLAQPGQDHASCAQAVLGFNRSRRTSLAQLKLFQSEEVEMPVKVFQSVPKDLISATAQTLGRLVHGRRFQSVPKDLISAT